MKVAELIELLKAHPEDAEACIEFYEEQFGTDDRSIQHVRTIKQFGKPVIVISACEYNHD